MSHHRTTTRFSRLAAVGAIGVMMTAGAVAAASAAQAAPVLPHDPAPTGSYTFVNHSNESIQILMEGSAGRHVLRSIDPNQQSTLVTDTGTSKFQVFGPDKRTALGALQLKTGWSAPDFVVNGFTETYTTGEVGSMTIS